MPTDLDSGIDFTGSTLQEGASQPQAPGPTPTVREVTNPPVHAETSVQRFFPLPKPPLATFRGGARYFGAPRSGGSRLHAACDLLAPVGTPIRAIADGVVLQAPYFFYSGTNALEVRHPGIGIVRYGEIHLNKVVHLKGGEHVRAGDIIAYVGRLDSGSSMLHFELYSGSASGSLTVRGNPPYQRRHDLVNPSTLVDELSRKSFGHAV